jgi:triacylglycerol lipase
MSESRANLSIISLLQELGAIGEFASFCLRSQTRQMPQRAKYSCSILVIPGFLAGDASLYPFARWLMAQGHRVFFSGILTNADCPQRAIERLVRVLQDLIDKSRTKVVVIGHSLGGIYARELARRFPERVARVVLLAAPVREPLKHSNPCVRALAQLTFRLHETGRGCSGEFASVCGVHSPEPPAGVPETLIYSKTDGVVHWSSCIESGSDVEAIEVRSTHCGLPYNADTMRIIQDLLERLDPQN